MAARSPARFLAPIALVAFAFALYTVVENAREKGGGTSSSSGTATQTASPGRAAKKTAARNRARHRRKIYHVRAGDTPSSIAFKYGITVQQLQKLNPAMDPQALIVGERLRLRK